ncbi:MAG: precorrin-8X methylmutase [Cyanobacteria bacterium P01_H01_bin.15]
MEWTISDAQGSAIVEAYLAQLGCYSSAQTALLRQMLLATADLGLVDRFIFANNALFSGCAALAARVPIIVDVPLIQAAVSHRLGNTFGSPMYCALEVPTRASLDESQVSWGMRTFCKHHPQGIFVVGQRIEALATLLELLKERLIEPLLVIATPPSLADYSLKKELQQVPIPLICLDSKEGHSVLASTMLVNLIELAWIAYGDEALNNYW